MSRVHGSKDFWLASLRADAASFMGAVSQPDVLATGVPSCPDWTVGDLTRHLGTVYRRYRLYAGTGRPDEAWPAYAVAEDAPSAADERVVAWFREELTQVLGFFETLDPDRPAWNWAPQRKTASFWYRRAAHETAVHRWDVQLSTGLPEPLEGKLAADTVAEALDTYLPAGRRRTRSEPSGLVHLVATDLGQEWYVRLRGEGVVLLDTGTLLDDDTHPARAAASGTASDLALFLWGRVNVEVIETAGDVELVKALRIA